MIQNFLVVIMLFFLVFSLESQNVVIEESESEKYEIQLFIGVSTDFLSIRSNSRFGFWSGRGNIGIPFERRSKSSSSFSILPFAGIKPSESVDIGLAYNHRTESSRTILKEGEIDPVEVNFLSRSNLNGFGLFSRIKVYHEDKFSVFIRPSIMYYIDNYREFRDSKKDLSIDDRFIYLNLGIGLSYAFANQLNGFARFSGISYLNGRWRELGTETGESYSEAGRNYSRSGIYLGIDWTF